MSTTKASLLRLLTLALLASTVGLLLLVAPALAAAPEAPHTEAVTANTGTSITFNGTLNPGASPQGGIYQFLYKKVANGPGCEGESATPGGAVAGLGPEHVTEAEAVEPNTEYTVCLAARNAAEEPTVGNAITFTTKPIPPTIESESVSNVKAGEAHLEGLVNPNNQLTECHFQYGETLAAENTVPCEPLDLPDTFGGQGVGVTVGLNPDTTYHYRIVAKNGKGEENVPTEQTFKSALSPETPEKAAATPIAATEATLQGFLNPGSERAEEPGTYEFRYRQSATECQGGATGEEKKTPETAAPGLEQNQPAEAKVEGLLPGATYTFCLLAKNEAGEESGVSAAETFTTLAAAPKVTSESASSVTATEAMLNAQIDPNGAATEYHFQYGTTESYGAGTPTAKLEGTLTATDIAVAKLSGLAPGTTYHYRVVATNEVAGKTETEDGKDKTFTTSETPTTTETCPNEKLRAEQPYGLGLPDCRAYEIVSPLDTEGQDATEPALEAAPRASICGKECEERGDPAIVYTSQGTFADPAGDTIENQFVSRRGSQGWSTQSVETPHEPNASEPNGSSFLANDLTPELTEGVASSSAKLTSEAPVLSSTEHDEELYVDDFATGSYRYVNGSFTDEGNGYLNPVGSSTDLSHVVFGDFGTVSEWVNGATVPVSVTNKEGENMEASAGAMRTADAAGSQRSVWHAVSADGSRVYFTSPAVEEVNGIHNAPGQLYVRVHSEQPQSPIASPEAKGTGTLTASSNIVTPLAVAEGTTFNNEFEGETEILLIPNLGKFVVGELISGPQIAPGTKITEVTEGEGLVTLHLSAAITVTGFLHSGAVISAGGPAPFAVGQEISGDGIPSGTTITKAEEGKLTLSKRAVSSGSGVELRAGGGCTEPPGEEACTIDVSASQRLAANPAGIQKALYWGASTGGEGGEGGPEAGGPEKVFFTSNAELTEDAYTGAAGNAANLYECELVEEEAGQKISPKCDLKDLTVPATAVEKAEDPEGAAVLGVVQISEDGSYVYFVAKGALAPGATAQTCTGSGPGEGCNLYVSQEGRAPVFIATLAAGDRADWHAGSAEGEGGPELNTAVVTPAGSRLAFLSEKRLPTVNLPAGYDNEPADPADCRANYEKELSGSNPSTPCTEIFLYDAETGGLECASCNPTGARPIGPSSFTAENGHADDLYRARNLLEDGALFFDSSDALVPHATGGRRNVYEYEQGQVHAISDVAGGSESFFMDASANGENVFFGTADDLLPQVTSNNVAVYDARVDGGFPAAAAAPSCDNADSCKPPESPQPPVFGAPSSATFAGPDNPPPPAVVKPKPKPLTRAQKLVKALKVCAKDKQKSKRAKCQKQARSKYGAKKSAKKASHNGRTKS